MAEREIYHAMDTDEVLKRLDTTLQGISAEEARARLERFGRNVLEEEEINRFRIFLQQFRNFLVYILIGAAAISLFAADIKDFGLIVAIILVNGFIGYWQELRAETSIRALKKLTESKVTVVRDGQRIQVPSSELVPGDVIHLAEGDLVTADIRLFESAGLMVDEATLTGESIPVTKDSRILLGPEAQPYEMVNSVLAGTTVVRGSGSGFVVFTGHRTYLATIAEKAQESSPDSPFTRAIRHFSVRYAVLLIILLALVGTIGFLQGREAIGIAYLLVAQMVSAVPAGLPLVVTLVMVIGAVALSRKQTLTRHLPSVETLGSATVIASDKTGTITEGRLAVQDVYALNPDDLVLAAALCNDAREGMGDPIDVALSRWAADYAALRKRYPRTWVFPFDTSMKLMAAANDVGGTRRFFIKGAFEELAKRAENPERLPELEERLRAMAGAGLRVLAFGAGDWHGEDPDMWRYDIVGLVGFLDPPKEGVREAVLTARKAGIHVTMITGDYPLTARAIAAAVGIWKEGETVLTGREIESLSDGELFAALKTSTVLARVLPEHKYRVVRVLQDRGEIVAVSGDGVNDVPALKAADLGIAMGSGTEAAKSVAKMVIVDNNLRVIVDAIRNGRVIVHNVRKVIYYLLSTSITEVALISTTIFAGLPLPLFPIQILWINLVTDGVQDKFFPFIKEEGDMMNRPPTPPQRQFFDRRQITRILLFGLVMGIASFLLFEHLLRQFPYENAVAILFTAFVGFQWFNGIQAQKEREPFFMNVRRSLTINPLIFLGVLIGLVLQLIAIYLVPGWFNAVPLAPSQWAYVALLSVIAFALVELIKWVEYCVDRDARRPG
ncbi:MAG: cation-transporting P-type ATPase [Methanomicrobiales archaeon]|nr:cation-transporting P-type ATPase [Methanomicrobiales archaeon]